MTLSKHNSEFIASVPQQVLAGEANTCSTLCRVVAWLGSAARICVSLRCQWQTSGHGWCVVFQKAFFLAVIVVSSASTLAQPATNEARGAPTYHVLHAFTGGSDGGGIQSSLAFDMQGNLYGTTFGGGAHSGGTVFQLTPQLNGQWNETVLHSFPDSFNDGGGPNGGPILDGTGNLYGTTIGGGVNNRGTVFELSPDQDGWTEQILYSFCAKPNCVDGGSPWAGLLMDHMGTLYGTGSVAFQLSPDPAGWTETVLHDFTGQNGDGYFPQAGVIADPDGNLYGTTAWGGGSNRCTLGCGTVYQLQSVREAVRGPWPERILHAFGSSDNDGRWPSLGQLAMDHAGNLYGTTNQGGAKFCNNTGCGTIFKLSRTTAGGWVERVLYNFQPGVSGSGPGGGVVLDKAGNLYGTTIYGGSPLCGCGVVYKLTKQAGGQWQYSVLHTFVGSDGAQPDANLTIGPDGNIYSTTATGGAGGAGVVFQLTP